MSAAADVQIRNAIVESVAINDGERGLLTAWLSLNYGGSGQGFGGLPLFLPGSYRHSSAGPNYAGLFIWRCMQVGGVTDWSDLKGKTVRVKATPSKVIAIGHIVKDDWFDPAAEFARLEKGAVS